MRSWPYFSSAANFSSGFWLGDAVAAAHLLERLQQLLAADAEAVVHRQQQVLDGEEVVLQVLAVLLGVLDDVVELPVHPRLVAAVRLGQLGDRLVGLVAHHQRGLAELGEHGRARSCRPGASCAPSTWSGVSSGLRQRLGLVDGRGERLLGLERPLLRVDRHDFLSCFLSRGQ